MLLGAELRERNLSAGMLVETVQGPTPDRSSWWCGIVLPELFRRLIGCWFPASFGPSSPPPPAASREPALWAGGNLGRAMGSYYEFALTGKLSSPNGAGPTPHASDCCRPNAHPDGQIRASHHMPVIKIHRRVHVRVRTYTCSGAGPWTRVGRIRLLELTRILP